MNRSNLFSSLKATGATTSACPSVLARPAVGPGEFTCPQQETYLSLTKLEQMYGTVRRSLSASDRPPCHVGSLPVHVCQVCRPLVARESAGMAKKDHAYRRSCYLCIYLFMHLYIRMTLYITTQAADHSDTEGITFGNHRIL